jgi:hypothetical protein
LGKRHTNATPDTPTKRQILKRRITTFQKTFGLEFIQIWVDILAVMSQVNAADDMVPGSSEEPISSTVDFVIRANRVIPTG